jgi:hypothetical protein
MGSRSAIAWRAEDYFVFVAKVEIAVIPGRATWREL